MNKYDRNSRLMEFAAEDRHTDRTDRTDGKPQRFSAWKQPLVKAGDGYGTAVAYTRSYGLAPWYEPDRKYQIERLPAAQIKRVEADAWLGIRA